MEERSETAIFFGAPVWNFLENGSIVKRKTKKRRKK